MWFRANVNIPVLIVSLVCVLVVLFAFERLRDASFSLSLVLSNVWRQINGTLPKKALFLLLLLSFVIIPPLLGFGFLLLLTQALAGFVTLLRRPLKNAPIPLRVPVETLVMLLSFLVLVAGSTYAVYFLIVAGFESIRQVIDHVPL